MSLSALAELIKTQRKTWLLAYIATAMLPIALIFNRVATEIMVAAIGLLFLTESSRSKQWKWLADPVMIIGLMAWLWLLFSSALHSSLYPSAFGIAIAWVRYILLYAALKNWVLAKKEYLFLLGKILISVLILVLIDTLWQHIFSVSLTGHPIGINKRLTGPLDSVKVGIFLAKILYPIIGIYLAYSVTIHKKQNSIFGLFVFLAAMATIMLSGERTAFFSTLMAFFIVLLMLAIFNKSFRTIAISLLLLLSLESAILYKTQGFVQERSHQFYEIITNYQASEYGQLQKAGIIIGLDNFWTGAGLKSFRIICEKMFAEGIITTSNLHPHNIYIEWFAETGIIGALLFIAMVISLFMQTTRKFLSNNDTAQKIACSCALATLIVSFFPFMPTQSAFSNWPAILLWYSISVAIASINAIDAKKHYNTDGMDT